MIVANTLFTRLVRNSPYLLIALLVVPVAGGLLGVLLPAFSWLPALNETSFNLSGFSQLFSTPGINKMVWLSFSTSLISTLLAFLITILILASYFNSPWLNAFNAYWVLFLLFHMLQLRLRLAF